MTYTPTAQRIIDVLTTPTARDKQRRIGPSEIGDMCERCLAEKLLATGPVEVEGVVLKPTQRSVTIPPLLGTAMHAYLDERTSQLGDVLREVPVTVGEIRRYGEITGSMDHYNITFEQTLDYKVVGKKKLDAYRRAVTQTDDGTTIFDNNSPVVSTLKKYWIQLSLYSRGMELLGHEVSSMSLLLIPRDDTTADVESACNEIVFSYDPEIAIKALDRASQIYEWAIDNPQSLSELASDNHCYYCNFERWKLDA